MRPSNLPLIAPPLVREHRLYQADWLLRFYGFKVEELTTPEAPDLPLGMDPKLAWALRQSGAISDRSPHRTARNSSSCAGPRRTQRGPHHPSAPLASRFAGGPDAAAGAVKEDNAFYHNGGSSPGAGGQHEVARDGRAGEATRTVCAPAECVCGAGVRNANDDAAQFGWPGQLVVRVAQRSGATGGHPWFP